MRLPLHAEDDAAIKSAIRNIEANDPPREMIVEMPPKITVRITDGTVRATAGNSEMALDQPDGGGGTVTVFAGGTKITMNQDGDVTLEAVGDLTLRSGGSMTLDASQSLTIKAGADASLQAEGCTVGPGLRYDHRGNGLADRSGVAHRHQRHRPRSGPGDRHARTSRLHRMHGHRDAWRDRSARYRHHRGHLPARS